MTPTPISPYQSERMIQQPPPQKVIKTEDYNRLLYSRIRGGEQAAKAQASTPYDYSSVHNMQLSDKLKFLKGYDFDPTKLEDPRDEINAWLYRWKNYAGDAEKHLLDYKGQKDLDARAGEFYDKALAPAFKRMGKDLPDRERWIANAYDVKDHWELEDQYSGKFMYGARAGLYALGAAAAQMGKTFSTMFGAFMSPPVQITDENWQKQLNDANKKGAKPEGFWQNAEALADSNHLFNAKDVRIEWIVLQIESK